MPFPNEQQRKVIEHRGRPLIVVAAPGTGKTSTLVERLIRLLEESADRDVSFITFTRTSRRNTKRKIENVLGVDTIEEIGIGCPKIVTLHTYAKSIVHHFAGRISRPSFFSILIEEKNDKELILNELKVDLGLNTDISLLNKGLTQFRATNTWLNDFPLSIADRERVLNYFDKLLIYYNAFDIQGLVIAACSILENSIDSIPPLYLQVDEYQDLNPNDQKLVKLIASHSLSQVVVVGDDAQSIYGFRYANYEGIRELWSSEDWEKVSFGECHRLPAHIQNAVRVLLANKNYIGSNLSPCDSADQKILTLQCTSSNIQIKFIANKINELVNSEPQSGEDEINYSSFMVLCPTTNFMNSIASLLDSQYNIPIKLHTKISIPDEHWKLLLLLRILLTGDNLAFRQWLTFIGIDNRLITQIRRASMQRNASLLSYCSNLSETVIRNFIDNLESLHGSIYNVELFMEKLFNFPNLSINTEVLSDFGLNGYESNNRPVNIENIIQLVYEKFGLIDTEIDIPDENKVLITTLYSAKGLESNYVFIPWMNSKYMPMSGRDADEERRVLYVALTRAKKDVFLCFHESYDSANNRRLRLEVMSPFLHEIREYLQIQRITASDVR